MPGKSNTVIYHCQTNISYILNYKISVYSFSNGYPHSFELLLLLLLLLLFTIDKENITLIVQGRQSNLDYLTYQVKDQA